jgi:hypothetical protein
LFQLSKPNTSIFVDFKVGGELFSSPIIVQQTRYSGVSGLFYWGKDSIWMDRIERVKSRSGIGNNTHFCHIHGG